MTPTINTLLLVAAFWTVPATIAALFYRAYGSSFEHTTEDPVANSVQRVGDYVVAALPTA